MEKNEKIDLRGVTCPTNYIKAKLALEDLAKGDLLQILLDDGEQVKNVPASLKTDGHRVRRLQCQPEGHYILEVEKLED